MLKQQSQVTSLLLAKTRLSMVISILTKGHLVALQLMALMVLIDGYLAEAVMEQPLVAHKHLPQALPQYQVMKQQTMFAL
jgi:hypothetical protein